MSVRSALVLTVLALAAAGCGEDPKTPTPSGGNTAPPTTGAKDPVTPAAAGGNTAATPAPTGTGPRRARPIKDAVLPDAPPLNGDGARRTLVEAVTAARTSPDAVRDALMALAATSGADAVRAAAKEMLAPAGAEDAVAGYASPADAAVALEALHRAGDATAAEKGLALARAMIEADVATVETVNLLAALGGADAAKLLAQLTDDPIVYAEAIRALTPMRDASAASRIYEVATDAEEIAPVRASAAAALIAARDPRGATVLEGLMKATEEDVTPADLIDGLASKDIPDVLPWMRKIADPVIAEGENCTMEIMALSAAIVDVRGVGRGTKEDVEYLHTLLGRDNGMADDEVSVALWQLGDDSQTAAVAKVLTTYVAGVEQVFDEEMGVRILEAIAARHAGDRPEFTRIIDAAAQMPVPDDPRRPDAALRAWRVRVAAARARLGK